MSRVSPVFVFFSEPHSAEHGAPPGNRAPLLVRRLPCANVLNLTAARPACQKKRFVRVQNAKKERTWKAS